MAITLLEEGSRGPEVVDLQYLLLFRGGFSEVELGRADGIFGRKTKGCVMEFQGAKGLIVDAVVGPKTWAALAYPEEWPNRIAGEFVREGDRGAGVKALQQGLKSKQLYSGALDGIFGPFTKASVIRLQRLGSPTTNIIGIVGPFSYGAAIGC